MFIELTKVSGNKVSIKKEHITAVTVKDGVTCVYDVGGAIPFEVKETYADVMAKLVD